MSYPPSSPRRNPLPHQSSVASAGTILLRPQLAMSDWRMSLGQTGANGCDLSRECDLKEFFHHENQSHPAALHNGGKLHTCQKPYVTTILESQITTPEAEPDADTINIHGAALVNSLPPWSSKTFIEHTTEADSNVIIIKASDTNVVVIEISIQLALQELQQLWDAFGQGQNLQVPVHYFCSTLAEKRKGMLFFHTFTGCDVISAFRGNGKKSAWQTWDVCDEASGVFNKLIHYLPYLLGIGGYSSNLSRAKAACQACFLSGRLYPESVRQPETQIHASWDWTK
ncbi:unnamed protein product [Acanthosepion pharaonis]|uniref:Uncharacterized protein n=1 Tax=Acanthosepion pharaonis TaxID=158019 RepID=A0A812D3E0_ACAPH|nr:unnamed protein product [Sepia pharaonis]